MDHTPGPWYTGPSYLRHGEIVCREPLGPGDAPSVVARIYCFDGPIERRQEVRLANTLLVAAAPDLLKALEGMLHKYDPNHFSSDDEDNAARAAIEKAYHG